MPPENILLLRGFKKQYLKILLKYGDIVSYLSNNSNETVQKLIEAENCRLGISGVIDIGKAKSILNDIINESDYAFVTLNLLKYFGDYNTESLFDAVRSMVLWKLRAENLGLDKSAFNMTVEVDGKTDVLKIRTAIDAVITETVGDIKCIACPDGLTAEYIKRISADIDIAFFDKVTDSVFNDIDGLRNAFEATSGISKVMFVSPEINSRLKSEYSSFYYQTVGHTHNNHPSAIFGGYMDIYCSFMHSLSQRHTVTADFCSAIKEYIEAVYPTADLQGNVFIDDLIRRVELQMITAPVLSSDEKGFIVTGEGVPYSRRLEKAKEHSAEAPAAEAVTASAAESASSEKTASAADAEIKAPAAEPAPAAKPAAADEIPLRSLDELTVQHEVGCFDTKDASKNILLLSLSTFPFGNMRESEYEFSGNSGTRKYKGIYQLDSVPKMLSELLGENGQYLDEIIMLATKPTIDRSDKTRIIEYIAGPGESAGKKASFKNISPEQFFKSQVRNYLRPLKEEENGTIDDDPRFVRFEIADVNDPSNEIKAVVDHIRGQYEKAERNNGDVNLYIDAHGSLRGLSLATLAINSLLLNEGKGAKTVYSVMMGNVNTIIEDRADELFGFVSGLNEFRSFGRIDSLDKYMGGAANALTEGMKGVADAISICNMNEFEKSIEKISRFYSGGKSVAVSGKENYLSIFKNAIELDYGRLLKKNHTIFDEIEWCLNKKLYQAALTLVESKVPGYIFGETTFESQKNNKNIVLSNVEVHTAKLPLYHFDDKDIAKWKDSFKDPKTNDYFADYIVKKICYSTNGGKWWNFKNDTFTPECYNNGNLQFDIRWDEQSIGTIRGEFAKYHEDVEKFLLLLRILKNIRNSINHSKFDNNPIKTQTIDSELKAFLTLARKLLYINADSFRITDFSDNKDPEKRVPVGELINRNNEPARISQASFKEYKLSMEYKQGGGCDIGKELKVYTIYDKPDNNGSWACSIVFDE